MRLTRCFDHFWTKRGFREGVPCDRPFGVHEVTSYMFSFRSLDLMTHFEQIKALYTPSSSLVDAVINMKNHMGGTWRRFSEPEAKALIEHHIKGRSFDQKEGDE